jgi:GNAT superfamily N-acetyltransferase
MIEEMNMNIQKLDETYRDRVNAYIKYLWGGPGIVTRGNLYDSSNLPGFTATEGGELLGAILYRPDGDELEVAVLFSLVQGRGVGTALLDVVAGFARVAHMRRVWLVTTNDNTHAIRFYQKYGFTLKAVHIGSMETTRKLKSSLPLRGIDGIPLEHEFEFEFLL